MSPARFRQLVFAYYEKEGRHDLPWRKTQDPYKILVSEVMLQQTQVERAIPYFERWMKQYPTVQALAQASLGEVLTSWQGLGYNRRGKALWEAANVLAKSGTPFPRTAEDLEKLPGVGPYTARAVMAFAYNADVIFVETNIRTVVTHHFFSGRKIVDDKAILKILTEAHPKGRTQEWYAALMDYGSFLKRSGVRINAKVKGYTKQSKFSGSDREARGAILKELTKGPAKKERLEGLLGDDRKEQLTKQIQKLLAEGMIEKTGIRYGIPT